jgi:hypothetical protein
VLLRFEAVTENDLIPCPLCLGDPRRLVGDGAGVGRLTASHVTPDAQLKLLAASYLQPLRSRTQSIWKTKQMLQYMLCTACESKKNQPGEDFFLKLGKEFFDFSKPPPDRVLSTAETRALHHYAVGLFFTGMLSGCNLLADLEACPWDRSMHLLEMMRQYLLHHSGPAPAPWVLHHQFPRVFCHLLPLPHVAEPPAADVNLLQSGSRHVHRSLVNCGNPQLLHSTLTKTFADARNPQVFQQVTEHRVLLWAQQHFFNFSMEMMEGSASMLNCHVHTADSARSALLRPGISPQALFPLLTHASRALTFPFIYVEYAEREAERKQAVMQRLTLRARRKFEEIAAANLRDFLVQQRLKAWMNPNGEASLSRTRFVGTPHLHCETRTAAARDCGKHAAASATAPASHPRGKSTAYRHPFSCCCSGPADACT